MNQIRSRREMRVLHCHQAVWESVHHIRRLSGRSISTPSHPPEMSSNSDDDDVDDDNNDGLNTLLCSCSNAIHFLSRKVEKLA